MVKVMREVKGQGHIVGKATNLFTSFLFYTNQPCQSWNTSIQQFDL